MVVAAVLQALMLRLHINKQHADRLVTATTSVVVHGTAQAAAPGAQELWWHPQNTAEVAGCMTLSVC